jgi:hypothetical protein
MLEASGMLSLVPYAIPELSLAIKDRDNAILDPAAK